jgi:hypothetical protein
MTFKTGSSGNLKGRPQGSGHRQQLFNALVEPHREALFDTGINLALAGNESMLRLFLDRMLPSKPTDDTIDIDTPEDLKKACSLLEYGENTLKAVSQGQLTPQQAKTVMSTIEMQRKNVETSEIVDRMLAIERTLRERK